MKFVHFTKPGGGLAEINPDQVESFREVEPGEFHPMAKTVIFMVAGSQAVREDINTVEQLLGA